MVIHSFMKWHDKHAHSFIHDPLSSKLSADGQKVLILQKRCVRLVDVSAEIPHGHVTRKLHRNILCNSLQHHPTDAMPLTAVGANDLRRVIERLPTHERRACAANRCRHIVAVDVPRGTAKTNPLTQYILYVHTYPHVRVYALHITKGKGPRAEVRTSPRPPRHADWKPGGGGCAGVSTVLASPQAIIPQDFRLGDRGLGTSP